MSRFLYMVFSHWWANMSLGWINQVLHTVWQLAHLFFFFFFFYFGKIIQSEGGYTRIEVKTSNFYRTSSTSNLLHQASIQDPTMDAVCIRLKSPSQLISAKTYNFSPQELSANEMQAITKTKKRDIKVPIICGPKNRK